MADRAAYVQQFNAQRISGLNTESEAGKTGRPFFFSTVVSAVVGGFFNASKSDIDFATGGEVTGLASAHNMEMRLPNITMTGGVYCCAEMEMTPGASSVTQQAPTGNYACFQFFGLGSNNADFKVKGYLFSLQGLGAAGAGNLFDSTGTTTATHELRILIGTTEYFIMLHSTQ